MPRAKYLFTRDPRIKWPPFFGDDVALIDQLVLISWLKNQYPPYFDLTFLPNVFLTYYYYS